MKEQRRLTKHSHHNSFNPQKATILVITIIAAVFLLAGITVFMAGRAKKEDTGEKETQSILAVDDLPKTDLNRNGIPEELRIVDAEEGEGKELEVWESGERIHREAGGYVHTGQKAVFLCRLDGEDYLLRYRPTMYQGCGDYDYELFTMVDDKENTAQRNAVSFDINFGSPIHGEFEAEKIAAFMEEVNGLLAQSIPLIVTDNELSKTFEKEGALRDTLWWLDGEETGFVRDSSRSLSENLRIFEETMNGKERRDDVPETDYGFFSAEIVEADFGGYFDGLKGAAVLYDAEDESYMIYQKELADERTSPCSTFKIISSCIALENGVVVPDESLRRWSGEIFWNEEWNRDIDFRDAFRESCVWYFREVIDEIGPELMQEELNALRYGNGDISDWEGRLNTNNSNPALTGFWIESSLKISPKEQTEVMERIFGEDTVYSADTIRALKEVMLEQEQAGVFIYGKTGMGKERGVIVDAWYTGFAEKKGERVYFCVYLGENGDRNASSTAAKEIAKELIMYYFDAGEENQEA